MTSATLYLLPEERDMICKNLLINLKSCSYWPGLTLITINLKSSSHWLDDLYISATWVSLNMKATSVTLNLKSHSLMIFFSVGVQLQYTLKMSSDLECNFSNSKSEVTLFTVLLRFTFTEMLQFHIKFKAIWSLTFFTLEVINFVCH